MSKRKRVAVIGAGASGLVAIKCCLDEGLEPVCFERTSHIGGLWYYTDDVTDGQGSVTKTTVINTSKEVMAFSDFPVPKEFPNFMHNTKVLEYFRLYAKRFDLMKHVRLNTEVKHIGKTDDFSESGRWDTETVDKSDGKTNRETFDGVLVCSGHHAFRHAPCFEGQDVFQGRVMHSNEYRNHVGFEDKTVVIVGFGNSAGDAAVVLSRIASQVYISTRRGSWVAHRLSPGGLPLDAVFLHRWMLDLMDLMPQSWADTALETMVNWRVDHDVYNLRPSHRFFSQHLLINDDLPNRIACGDILIKPHLKRFTKTGVEFVDGTVVENVDVVILATGYVFGFPFLERGVVDVERNRTDLFKYVFPPHLEKHTLATIGFVQVLGPINPVSELQCRWATRVIKGIQKLPSKEEMWADIHHKRTLMARRYVDSQRHTIQVDFVPYLDELAKIIGCRPNIGRLFLEDPQLACAVYFGTCTPFQYRIQGPGSWTGAREALLTQWDRMFYPLRMRRGHNNKAERKRMRICWKTVFAIFGVTFLLACLV